MQTICTLPQTDKHTNTSSLNFADWMLFLMPNQQHQITEEILNRKRGMQKNEATGHSQYIGINYCTRHYLHSLHAVSYKNNDDKKIMKKNNSSTAIRTSIGFEVFRSDHDNESHGTFVLEHLIRPPTHRAYALHSGDAVVGN